MGASWRSVANSVEEPTTPEQQSVFVRDLQNNTTQIVDLDGKGNALKGWTNVTSISPDGRFVVLLQGVPWGPGVAYGDKVVLRDRLLRKSEDMLPGAGIDSYRGFVNGNGQLVAFTSDDYHPGGSADYVLLRNRAAK